MKRKHFNRNKMTANGNRNECKEETEEKEKEYKMIKKDEKVRQSERGEEKEREGGNQKCDIPRFYSKRILDQRGLRRGKKKRDAKKKARR